MRIWTRHRGSADAMMLTALFCAALMPFILVQATPGNIFSAKKPRKPLQSTGIIASLPPLPKNLLVPQTPNLESYMEWVRQQVRLVPRFSKSDIQGSGWRLDLTSMLGVSSNVHEQMAKEDPAKRQYLPLFMNGEDKGWGNPLKTYAMPLDPRYFDPATTDPRLSKGRTDEHTFAILGVWHKDPADVHE